MGASLKAEPYTGEIMHQCLIHPWDFEHTNAIVVSGATWNPCGHMLLNTGGVGGWYFHVAEVRGNPRFMRHEGYSRYLKEHGKKEITRTYVKIPDPSGAHRMLEELLAKQWTWFILPNNCTSFVEDVVRAGGSKAGLYFNCPAMEFFR